MWAGVVALFIGACTDVAVPLHSDDATSSATTADDPIDYEYPACARYIGCVAALAPAAAAEVVDGFGPEGSCWTPETADLCVQSCIEARLDLMMLNPNESACWDCTDDTHCSDAPALTCEPQRRICVEHRSPSGVYLVAVSLPAVPPQPHLSLQFIGWVAASLDAEGTGTVELELQPLSLDLESTTEPREEIGDRFSYQAAVTEWSYVMSVEDLVIPPEADPVDGVGFVLDDVEMTGSFANLDAWCGHAEGDIVYSDSPDLGFLFSSFAAVRLSDRDERPLGFPLSCGAI